MNPVFTEESFLDKSANLLLDEYRRTKGTQHSTTVNYKGRDYTVSIGSILILDQLEGRWFFGTHPTQQNLEMSRKWCYDSIPKNKDGETGWRPYAITVIECEENRIPVRFA